MTLKQRLNNTTASSWLFFLITLCLISACDPSSSPATASLTEADIKAISLDDTYTETGDLNRIKSHGQLRILTRKQVQTWLPREGEAFDQELHSAIQFAFTLKLEPVLIYINHFEDLLPALQQGRGDIIAANLSITENRKQQIDFSVPLTHSREHIVSRPNDPVKTIKQLKGRRIAYKKDTAHQETIEHLQKKYTSIKPHIISGDMNDDDILDALNNKQLDLAIMDANRLNIIASYRNDFNYSLAVGEKRAIAWGLRQNNPDLLNAVNLFLTQQQLTRNNKPLYSDDFDAIKKRKTLRIITRNNAASYFLWRGELLGFEYELAKKFAQQHGLRLEVVTAPSHDQQIPMLLHGKGDIIASFMTITEHRQQQDVSFSRPHHQSTEIIVSRSKDKIISSLDDLAGRNIYVRKSSAYWETLNKLQQQGYKFQIKTVDENMETEEIIAHVASGKFDLTLADSHLLDIELTWRDDIQGALSLNRERDNAWLVRRSNPQLLNAVNQFLKKQHRSLFYNITYKKYFENSHTIQQHREQRIDLNSDGKLSPYDKLVKKYAAKHQFDWRLITAQMYQESRFDPLAKSWAGALGLMQVMPRTAKELGHKNLKDPETGIKAGVAYMNWVRDRFEEELNIKDRMWFTLAAYNAGHGHVRDARRLARQKGWDPDKWFNHVEKAILLLSKREYASKARHGYVRGTEPVNYVREISKRYYAYLETAK